MPAHGLAALAPGPKVTTGCSPKGVQPVVIIGAGEEIRTPDPRITNALLYQLSYAGFGEPASVGEGKVAIKVALRDCLWERPQPRPSG
jgi:hypothetical protein